MRIQPYALPAPTLSPLTPEQIADSPDFRAALRTAIEKARSDGAPVYVPAPMSLSISDFAAFWTAVEARLAGTGWTILPRVARDAGRGRVIGPAEGAQPANDARHDCG